MYYSTVYIFIAFLINIGLVICENQPVVETTHGQISGRLFKTLFKNLDYYAFMGIPFAEPPVGELRFMPPKPIQPWDGVLKAAKEKPECFQFNHNIRKGQPLGVFGSEDCLYLDIFTPGADEQQRAVVVVIVNNNFINSYNKTKDYAPDFFIEEDVVVVMISHRLSVLGFLSLENEMLPGNSGLRDIVEGLKWVKNNIEYFGGDPKKITLMGLQGGAAAIDLLMHSTTKYLFRAAILQSGTSFTSSYLQEEVKKRAFKLGEMVNITTTSETKLIKQLQEISPSELVARDVHASPDDYFKETQRGVIAFGPIVEKQPDGLITAYPESIDEIIDKPIMIGFNSREGMEPSLQYLMEPRYTGFLHKDFPVLLPRRLNFQFDPLNDVFEDIIEEIKYFYFPQGKINVKSVPNIITMLGDMFINYAVDYTAKLYSERSAKPVYYYHFDYVSDLNENKKHLMSLSTVQDGTWGAAAGDEMCYLFKCPDLQADYIKFAETNSIEIINQRKMVKLWTNFVKYGNPTPDDDESLEGLKWPSYTRENDEYLHIGEEITLKKDLCKRRFDFWDNFIEKWGKMAVDGVIRQSINKKDEL